jgi:hypothetical protein
MHVPETGEMREVSLDISGITYQCRVWESRRNQRVGGLIVFRGHYPPGSAGKDDALWIKWRLDEFYELARFDGLVVDCRELDYTWGDDLHLRPRSRRLPDDFPYRLVIRPEQQEVFAFAEPRECHRFELLVAVAEVHEQLQSLRGR